MFASFAGQRVPKGVVEREFRPSPLAVLIHPLRVPQAQFRFHATCPNATAKTNALFQLPGGRGFPKSIKPSLPKAAFRRPRKQSFTVARVWGPRGGIPCVASSAQKKAMVTSFAGQREGAKRGGRKGVQTFPPRSSDAPSPGPPCVNRTTQGRVV
eukprot:gene23261-biopygen22301